jgi:hypothetical protein
VIEVPFVSQRWNRTMVKLFALLGSTVGSYAGWYAGAPLGMFTAFLLSAVGGGIGIYYGRRLGQHYGG